MGLSYFDNTGNVQFSLGSAEDRFQKSLSKKEGLTDSDIQDLLRFEFLSAEPTWAIRGEALAASIRRAEMEDHPFNRSFIQEAKSGYLPFALVTFTKANPKADSYLLKLFRGQVEAVEVRVNRHQIVYLLGSLYPVPDFLAWYASTLMNARANEQRQRKATVWAIPEVEVLFGPISEQSKTFIP